MRGRDGLSHHAGIAPHGEEEANVRSLIKKSPLSKREIVRRLRTSATQLYRLLDQTNYRKSVDQLLSLLHVLDCDVDLLIKKASAKTAA